MYYRISKLEKKNQKKQGNNDYLEAAANKKFFNFK